jgi:hypothetical protein
MEEVFLFRPVQGTIQRQAVLGRMTGFALDMDIPDERPPHGIIADIHVAHLTGISADCDGKFLPRGQPIIHPVRSVLSHKLSTFLDDGAGIHRGEFAIPVKESSI